MSKTILAVDDSRTVRSLVNYSLTSAGYRVVDAVDGVDALEKAMHSMFDLVLTDQNMPELDGIGLIKSLRSVVDYQFTPILMLTTESSDEMKIKGKEAGATGWLVKPFEPEKLLKVVNHVLGVQ